MRARELFFESDNRNRIEKLVDMIEHPSTEDTIRKVAVSKLKLLLGKEEPLPEIPPKVITSITTNISQEYFDVLFLNNLTFGDCLARLSTLQPSPSRVEFMRQGQIVMLVQPPFNGQTRQQYFEQIDNSLPGIRKIEADYQLDRGYSILVSWI